MKKAAIPETPAGGQAIPGRGLTLPPPGRGAQQHLLRFCGSSEQLSPCPLYSSGLFLKFEHPLGMFLGIFCESPFIQPSPYCKPLLLRLEITWVGNTVSFLSSTLPPVSIFLCGHGHRGAQIRNIISTSLPAARPRISMFRSSIQLEVFCVQRWGPDFSSMNLPYFQWL